MKIEVYTVSELEDLIRSDRYVHAAEVPISPERVHSYMNNPRAEGDMPVLFAIWDDEGVVAYRTLLPDQFTTNGKSYSFAWLSGNYVRKGDRRKGYSTRLFRTVEEAWEGKLMYTNYAPASKAVYDHTGAFYEFAVRQGRRYYMRSSLETLFKSRTGNRVSLKAADRLINFFHDMVITEPVMTQQTEVHEIGEGQIDPFLEAMIHEQQLNNLFRRGKEEFQWILQYPWISTGASSDIKASYHFSRIADRFENRIFRIGKPDEGSLAFLWITIINDKLGIPYYFTSSSLLTLKAREIILSEMVKYGCSYLTTRHPALAPVLGLRHNPWILSRQMPQHYFAHQHFSGLLPADPDIQDGDGDGVFT